MKYNILLLIFVVLSLISCSDYLDLVPEKDIENIESLFERKSGALSFLATCYQGTVTTKGNLFSDPAICGADEFMSGEFSRSRTYTITDQYVPSLKIAEGMIDPNNPCLPRWGKSSSEEDMPFSNCYACIRYCNIFINNVDRVYDMTEDEKELYKAQAIAIKAYYYLQLVKYYGPIVLIPENLEVYSSLEEMQIPRSPVDTCINRIVELFDKAEPKLLSIKNVSLAKIGYMHKEAALAYRAKALLYAASPIFNGNSWYANMTNVRGEKLFSQSYDEKKWKIAAEAIDKAIKSAEENNLSLYDDIDDRETEMLNTIRNIQNSTIPINFASSEIIYGVWTSGDGNYKLRLPRYNPTNKEKYRADILGNINPTMRMVELFYTENGVPIDEDKTWPYTSRYQLGKEKNSKYFNVLAINKNIINLHLRREPRFYADIAFDKCYWERGKGNFVEMKPYKGDDHGNSESYRMNNRPQNLTGYWVKKMVPTTVSADDFSSLTLTFPFPAMRLAELYLLQAEAWNEFEGPSSKVYDAVNKVRERAGLPTVQTAWSKYSNMPTKFTTKDGMREIIRQETLIEFAFEGHRFWDLRRWKIAHEYQNRPLKGWNTFGEDSQSFYNNYEGPIKVWTKNKFEVPRDYFWPIRSEDALISNIKQNIGW